MSILSFLKPSPLEENSMLNFVFWSEAARIQRYTFLSFSRESYSNFFLMSYRGILVSMLSRVKSGSSSGLGH